MIELARSFLALLSDWIESPTPSVPEVLLTHAAAVEAAAAVDEHEGLFQTATSQLVENLRGYERRLQPDTQPDGRPGPRLLATVDLLRQRLGRIGQPRPRSPVPPHPANRGDEGGPKVDGPLPVEPIPAWAVRLKTPTLPAETATKSKEIAMSDDARMSSLLEQLQSVKPADVDQAIGELQERIDRLKQLRKLIAPKSRGPVSESGSELNLADVKAWLKAEGPQKPGAIGKHFGVHATSVGKALNKTGSGFTRLEDGRFSV